MYAEVRAAVSTTGRPDETARLRYVSRYNRTQGLAKRIPRPQQDAIALIQGQGQIRLGRSGHGALPGQGSSIGSETIAAAFRAAVKDEKVKAIVFRVDSPGGSYVASDTIWREVVLARQAGKPVIVSMGNVAASGGYFVAAPADRDRRAAGHADRLDRRAWSASRSSATCSAAWASAWAASSRARTRGCSRRPATSPRRSGPG